MGQARRPIFDIAINNVWWCSQEMAAEMSREDIAKTAEAGRWKNVKMQKKGLATLSGSSVILTYECDAQRKDGKPYQQRLYTAV